MLLLHCNCVVGLFTSAKAKLAAQKLAEEQLYELAAEEIAANNIRPGLWAKAIAEADGDDAKAKARYIILRVETMKAEVELSQFAREEAKKAQDKASDPEQKEFKPTGPPTEDAEVSLWTLYALLFTFGILLFVAVSASF
jgi:NAD(P)-dependent dehydrogenase (short-subunit alcohol dehydrogenase family)